MFFQLDDTEPYFPDPNLAQDDGLIAIGGDLSPQRLVNAYASGIFPWYNEGEPLLWWSLDPRMILFPDDFRCSKSLQRTLLSHKFEVRIDTAFRQVMESCGRTPRPDQDGTWITQEMIEAYVRLHELGLAHSFETYKDGELVGGLYGVSLGDLFFGESMFHTVTDASKVAFARLMEYCNLHGFRLIDAQQPTPHLASLGAKPIPRKDYLALLEPTDWNHTLQHSWNHNTVVLLIGGNQGDRQQLISAATDLIGERIGEVSLTSPLYETEPWGFEAEQNFLNQALVVDTLLSAEEVLHTALYIEHQLGRRRPFIDPEHKHYLSRPMDIDLIFYNSLVCDTPELQLPHPRMHLRRFVLQPLADIIPNFRHPKLHKSIRQLLAECPDTQKVMQFHSTSDM